jgi:hypothetical protein
MKILALVAMTVVMEIGAQADDVTVYVQGLSAASAAELGGAQVLANQIFAGAGVQIDWRRGRPPGSESLSSKPIVVEMVTGESGQLLPGALAFAQPYEGVHISVFCDRIRAAVQPDMTPKLLAHVLVHEITHILQGTSRHSDSGVMKARWTPEDYRIMRFKPLRFTEEDVQLIRFGVAARAGREPLVADTLVHSKPAQIRY